MPYVPDYVSHVPRLKKATDCGDLTRVVAAGFLRP